MSLLRAGATRGHQAVEADLAFIKRDMQQMQSALAEVPLLSCVGLCERVATLTAASASLARSSLTRSASHSRSYMVMEIACECSVGVRFPDPASWASWPIRSLLAIKQVRGFNLA